MRSEGLIMYGLWAMVGTLDFIPYDRWKLLEGRRNRLEKNQAGIGYR